MQSESGNRILVFAGTTEGRKIAEILNSVSAEAYVSVATEYGRSLLKEYRNIQVLCGRMDEDEIADFICKKQIGLVVDATHPFAVLATENIKKACAREAVQYLRCLREGAHTGSGKEWDRESEHGQDMGNVKIQELDSVSQAVEYLRNTEGNIFIATGSKELALYTDIENYRERCYARVLSSLESIEKTVALGFEGEHLIAMQGPFSKDINVAMLRHTKARYFVTKDSGKAGGFGDKLEAAKETGVTLVVVGRPKEDGMSVKEVSEYLLSVVK